LRKEGERRKFGSSLGQSSHEVNISVEMCCHAFFLKHALLGRERLRYSFIYSIWKNPRIAKSGEA